MAGDEGGKRFVAKLNPAKHPKVPGRVDVLTEAQVQQLDSLLPGRLLPPRRPPLSDASGVRRKLAVVHAAQQYLGEAEELADVIGRVVASLPPFRFRRQPNGDRAFVRFVRARWLQVLVADSGGGGAAQLPLLLLEHHCGGPAGASGFFDGVAPGDDVMVRRLRVCAAGGDLGGFLATSRWSLALRAAELLAEYREEPLRLALLGEIGKDARSQQQRGKRDAAARQAGAWMAAPPPPATGGDVGAIFGGLPPVQALLKRAGGEAAGAAGDAVRCDWRLQRPLVPIRDVARCLEELHGGEEAYVVLRASVAAASLSHRAGEGPPSCAASLHARCTNRSIGEPLAEWAAPATSPATSPPRRGTSRVASRRAARPGRLCAGRRGRQGSRRRALGGRREERGGRGRRGRHAAAALHRARRRPGAPKARGAGGARCPRPRPPRGPAGGGGARRSLAVAAVSRDGRTPPRGTHKVWRR